MTTRREFLIGASATALSSTAVPGLAVAAANTKKRFVLVVLRGGMDGLAAFPPLGDPNYSDLRDGLLQASDNTIALDQNFAMHKSLTPIQKYYRSGDMAIIHAIAVPQRTRSHFDAQNVLENGAAKAHMLQDGWLNRALGVIDKSAGRLGLAVGYDTPPVMRGSTPIASWAPARIPPSPEHLLNSLGRLYQADPIFNRALKEGRRAQAMTGSVLGDTKMKRGNMRNPGRFKTLAEAAGRLLAADQGARVAVIEMGGWDTHANQGAEAGRLARNLGLLGNGLNELAGRLKPVWRDTVICVVTEFGRTVRMNGSKGTDHGAGGAAILLGGAVAGGRVATHWPSLRQDALFGGRDLAATSDTRALFKTIMHQHFDIPNGILERKIFPDSKGAVPPPGKLVRT
ncbi:MAG: hypothetical protein CMM52_12095 [Rhodospirillaceae bacterium]|nr:hypothetical protein [Rhodospirillaceae bacterium]|tara:strand:- start:75922 stop:77118 length:1197 start_codon:yes stop_codon:yes gene_type:complete